MDVCDACRRVVDILDGRPSRRLHLTEPSILAAELFYPSDLFGQAPGMILGLASKRTVKPATPPLWRAAWASRRYSSWARE